MTFQDLYLGQRVRILSWDELNSIGYHDSIGGIHLPDDTFYLNGISVIFSSPMFEQSKPTSVPPSSLSFDSLLQGGDFF